MKKLKRNYIGIIVCLILVLATQVQASRFKEYQVNLPTLFPNTLPVATALHRNDADEIWILFETIDPLGLDTDIYVRSLRNGRLSNQFNISDNNDMDSNPTITSYEYIVYMGFESNNSVTGRSKIILVGERNGHSFQKPIEPHTYGFVMNFGLPMFPTLPIDVDYEMKLDPQVVVSSGISDNRAPDFTTDSKGRVHMVWSGRNIINYHSFDVYYRYYDNGFLSPILLVNDPNNYFDGNPKVSIDDSDEPLITWQGFDGEDMEIFYRKLSKVGKSKVYPIIQVTSNLVDDYNPSIACDNEETVSIAWDTFTFHDRNIKSARINIDDSSIDLLPYNVTVSKDPEQTPHLISLDSSEMEVVYTKTKFAQNGLFYRFIGDKISHEKQLPTNHVLSVSNPFGLLSEDDEVYFYEGKYVFYRNIFILGPEDLFKSK